MSIIATVIMSINPSLDLYQATYIAGEISQYAIVYDMDPRVVASIIAVESRFKANAVGKAGEVGLMQLHPMWHTARPEVTDNIWEGTRYLMGLKHAFYPFYKDLRWVEHYNTGPHSTPKKFTYYKKFLKFYKMFGGYVGPEVIAGHSRGKDKPTTSTKSRSTTVSGKAARTSSQNPTKRFL